MPKTLFCLFLHLARSAVSTSGRGTVAGTKRRVCFQEDSYSEEDSGTEEVSDADD